MSKIKNEPKEFPEDGEKVEMSHKNHQSDKSFHHETSHSHEDSDKSEASHKTHESNPEHQSLHHTKKRSSTWLIALGVLIVLLAIFNIWQIYHASGPNTPKIIPAKIEKAKIELAVLTVGSCTDCFDIKGFETQIASLDINITNKAEVDESSAAGKALIKKYEIDHVPAIIIKGDVSKSPQLSSLVEQAGKQKDNVYIVPALNPPYLDTATNQVLGRLTVISLTKENCPDCFDMSSVLELLKSQLKVTNVKKVSSQTEEGKALVQKYNITKLPTLIFSKEASLYPTITQVWKNIGSVEQDGSYIMRNVNPPYFDIAQGKVRGLVTLTVIKDKTCKECYDAKAINKPILTRLGLAFGEEKDLDASQAEAQGYIAKYKITKIPTIILSGDTAIYPSLADVWKEVGSIESDKSYVFRKVDLFQQPYKDLTLNKVITPAASSSSTTQANTPTAVPTLPQQ